MSHRHRGDYHANMRTGSESRKTAIALNHAAPRWQWVILTALVMLTVAPYLQTLNHDFIDYDDNQYITENDVVQGGLTWEGVQWSFTTFAASNWHPLTWLSHMADVEVWGMRAGGHHLSNVLLHGLNTVLVFLVFHRMTSAMWRSVLAAALFAVHPLHVESVAWVSERKDVLSTCFGLLALWWYVGYIRNPAWWRYTLVMMWFGLSLMSKPMLVTLPFVLLLLDVWPLGRVRMSSRSGWRRVLVEKVPLLIMAAGSSIMTVLAQSTGKAIHTLEMLPLSERVLNAATAYAAYLFAFLWPANLAVIYPLSSEQSRGLAVVSLAVLVAITGIAFIVRRRAPHVLIGWLIFLGTLVPVIGLIQVGMQARADRYMYVPMLGLCIMVAWSIPLTSDAPRKRVRFAAVASVVAMIALMCASWIQIAQWKDTQTLFTHALRVTQNNFIAHNTLGMTLRKAGQMELAKTHLLRALELRRTFPAAHNNLGLLYMAEGNTPKARVHFEASLALQPLSGDIWSNLGVVAVEQGRVDEAVGHYQRSIELAPGKLETHINLGIALLRLGRHDEAINAYQAALQIDPNAAKAHAGIGAAMWNLRRVEEAITNLHHAIELDGSMLDARVTLGVALAAENRLPEAIGQFEEVLRQQPSHLQARQFLDAAKSQQVQQPAN